MRALAKRLHLHTNEAGRFHPGTPVTYLFRKFEGANIVLARNDQNGETNLIEPRRDLYKCFGGFAWGYRGTGPKFLTTSLLAHHLNSQCMSHEQWERLLDYLDMCPAHWEFMDLSSSLLETVISG